MKKIFVVLGFVLISITGLVAQQQNALPVDPKVKYGKLDNGLTYYIRHNELPKERAEFFIAQNVGSILENDDQNGLAHFLEHMAFNGSKNFPGNSLISYLESIGVKFGVNLNAATGWDNTVYNISDVPVIREGIVDSCLLVLHDWSGALSLDDKEIDKERGVIREEMRMFGGADFRIMDKILPQILPNNQYSKRNIIGTEQIILNFKPQVLRDYYQKWYRPDLQAIIIVGDIDVDQVESKIKTMFADIPKPVNPAKRIYYQVEDNDEPLVGIVTDKEATSLNIAIDYKHKAMPAEERGTAMGWAVNYFNSAAASMLNDRLREIAQKKTTPFVQAYGYNGDFANTTTEESWSINAVVKENNVKDAFQTITREMERIDKFGFTASEYERARTNILTMYESAFKERDKTRNISYAQEYVRHFTKGEAIPGIEMEYNIITNMAPQIPVEAINQYIQQMIDEKNIVITMTAPEKEGVVVPSKDQLLAWFKEAKAENIQAYEDKVSDEPLMKELPKGGTIKNESKDAVFGTTNYTLSNGVKVVIKPTTFKDDEILMSATSPGGSSHFPESESVNAKLYASVADLGGLGSFSKTDLKKTLAGKKVLVNPTMNLTTEGFSGFSSPKDFETMLQLVYLNFTAPRMDEEAYQSLIGRTKSQLESQEASPYMALIDTMNKVTYKDTVRNNRLRTADLEKVNYQTIMNWRKDRYKDASDFTFVFVGNINPDSAKLLITKYLGALPSINRKESFVPVNVDFNKGIIKNDFNKSMENLKATVLDTYWGMMNYNMADKVKLDMLQQILTIVYTEKMREDEGGVYTIGVDGNIENYPKGRASIQVSFETDPAKKDMLVALSHKEFKAIALDGPRAEDFQKVKEYLLKNQQEQEQENAYWNGVITNYYRNGYNGYTDYVKTVNSMKPEDIKATAKALLDQNNFIEVIMTGVK